MRKLLERLWATRPRYFDQVYAQMGNRRCRWLMLGDRVVWQRWTVEA